MDSLSCKYNTQEIAPEPKNLEELNSELSKQKTDQSSKYLLFSFHRHSLKTVRITCEGNLHDPNFPRRLRKLISKLKALVSNENKQIKVINVEPWNSVRVTFNLSNDAAQRLRQLAELGDANLRELGILSVQIEGQQIISLMLQPNANQHASINNNIDQVNIASEEANNNSIVNSNKDEDLHLKKPDQNELNHDANKYLFRQVNGGIVDESSNSSSNNNNVEQSQISDNTKPKPNSISFGSNQSNSTKIVNKLQSMATSSVSFPPPYTSVPCQQPQVYLSQQPRTNNLHIASNQLNLNVQSQAKSNFISHPTNTSNSSEVSVSDSNLLLKKAETNSGLVENVNTTPVMIQQVRVQNTPFSSGEPSLMAVNPQKQFTNRPSSGELSRNLIRNVNSLQFNGPRPLLISSAQSPKTFISPQTTVPLVSKLQSQSQPMKSPEDSVSASSHSSVTVSEQSIKPPMQQPHDHNANYVNSSTFTSNTLSLYPSSSTILFSQPSTSAHLEPKTKNFSNTSDLNSQSSSGDILGSSVDGVDDEDLLASVTGANSIDLNNFTDLNDLNLLSMLEEMESVNHNTSQASTTTSSLDTVSTTSSNDSNQINDSKIASTSTTAVLTNVKNQEFRSPNVVAPQSTQPLPFFISQQQQQQQSSTKVGTTVVSGAKQILINSSTGAVLSQPQAHQLSQQIMEASTTTAAVSSSLPTSSTLYPFTSMQHASLFTAKQQPQPHQPNVPSSPRHVYLPVRQIPAVRAAASQQVPQQSQSMVRALQPSVANPTTDQMVQHSPQQTNLYRPSNSLIRQPLPSNSSNSSNLTSPIQNKSQQQQQQLVIRQNVPYSSSQQSTPPPSGQQNTVALSSPLLVNLLQSDVQQSNPLQQNLQPHQQQFVAQPGTQQIRFIQPGSHGDGTPLMMMVRVSSAPQGSTTQLINPATFVGAMPSGVQSSQVVTSIASHVMDQQANTIQSIESSSSNLSNTKAKKPRKPRKTKNQVDNKADGSVPSGIVTSIQQVTTAISSGGAITSIPLSLATSSPSRTQTSSVSTILSFPTSSLTQSFKLQATPPKPQQTILSGQTSTVSQHLFNQKQRVQPVVMIATSNANISDSANVSSSNTIATSKNAFIITNVAASSLGTNSAVSSSTTTTTTAGVQLSGKRKRILLATKSNSFPVSSALSAGAIMARVSNNLTSSTSTIASSPVKLVSQSMPPSSVPFVMTSSNSACLSSSESSITSTSSNSSECKSSLASMSSSVSLSSNLTSLATTLVTSVSNITPVSNSDLTTVSQMPSLPTNTAINVNTPHKMSISSALPSPDSFSMSSGTQSMIATPNMLVKGYQIPSNVPGNANNNSLLLNKLNQSNTSTCKILASSFKQMANKSPMKTIAVPVSQLPPAFQKQMLAITEEKNKERNLSVSNTSDSIPNHPHESKMSKCVSLESLLTSTETKQSILTKSISDAGFKLSLTDVLGSSGGSSNAPKLDPVFLSGDDDPDRIAEPEAPISPSYFLAPPPAFENKPNVDDASNVQSETKTEPSDSTNKDEASKEQQKSDNNPLLKSEQVSQSTAQSTVSLSAASKSISTTEQSSSSTTITTTSAIKSSPTVTTSVKLHDDVQTKSNCSFDSFSYFMSKHSYSQDLPDHILEDDEDGDDSDNDDFGLYPKSSHFLSGSVGSIGRNNSIAVSSTPTTPVVNISSTSSNVLPLSVASSSTPSSSTIADQKINSDTNKSDNKQENVKQVTEAISKNIPESIPIQKDLNENKQTVHDDKKSIENAELVKDATILKKNEKESQPSNKSDIRTLMNGDIFQSLANESDCIDSKSSNVVQVSHCLTSITCNSMESNSDSSTKQYPTINIVASKSYPLLNAATKNNPSNVPQNPNEPSSINYSEPAITTDKQSNLVETQSLSNEIQSNVSELTSNVTKNTKSRKTPSQPSSTKLTQPNKNRRKPVASVSTMSQTIAVFDSLYQTQNTATKSELHSLLASPTMTTKSNVSLDSLSSTSLSETLSNLTSSSETSCTPQRQVFYTFKQPNQTQTITSQTTDCTSTQVPTSTTFLKVLMPGVNNIAGNKLLTIATASSSANSSTNSSTISAQTLTSSIASHNPSESSSSQKPAMPSVFGRYYVNGPSGPQLVVFKPVMINDTRNATSSASMTSSQLKFTALQSKFSSVSGSSTSQPLIIPMVTSSTGQTILSMPPDIQATSSIESSNSPSSALNENEPKKFIARKTNNPNNHQSIIPAEPSVLLQQPNYSQQQQTCVSHATPLESTSISDGEIKPVTSLPNVTALDNSDNLNGPTTEVSKTDDDKSVKSLPDASSNRPSNGSQSVSSSNSINSSMKVIPSVVEKVLNKTDTASICEDKRSDNLQNPSKQQQPNVSETTTKTSNDKIETQIDNSFAKNESPNVASKIEIKPIVTSSPLVLPSIELTPVTTSASTNSNVALRTDTTRLKEAEKELSGSPLKINSRSNSPIGTRRPILIPKSSVGLHSQVSQLQTSQDLISNAIFATKSSGASITATKTLPTILRQSKRKADNFYQTSQSILNSSEQSNKIPQQNADYQASSDLAETFEMENSATTSMVSNPSNFAFRNHSQPASSEHNFSSPAIEFVDEISDHTGSDQMASRPRKRARKSKMTTLQQPANAGDLSTSLLLNEYNDVPIEISDDKTDSSDIEIKRSTTPTSSRVLRNSSSVSSTTSKSSVNKRGQRNNRSMLAHNSTAINISNAPSSPILLASDSTDDLVLKTNDKTREVSSKVGSRQTRSNRNKIKRLEPSMISDSNPEIIISDNAVDEQLQLDMNTSDAEFMSSLVAENSHETMASSSASVASSSMNQQININANTADQRSISILDSGNSNSSTASSNSSSNSLLIKRPRKSLSASATKPSLRSNSASETLASPITPTKRRRIAKETAK